MLTSQVNCLEETGHHVEAHGTCYCEMIEAMGKQSKDDIKAEYT